MEISDALVTAITRELLKRLGSGEVSFSEADVKKVLSDKACTGSACGTSPAAGFSPVQGIRKRVISETEIKRLCPASAGTGQRVELGLKDIVTPLAEDYIVKMQITVNRIG